MIDPSVLLSSPYLTPIIFFGVGSVEIFQDLSLLDQISLRGGICHSITRFLFGVGSLPFILLYVYYGISLTMYRGLLLGSFLLQYYNLLSMPQVFEQSLFLFS